MGQAQAASLVNALMQSPSWGDSVFSLAYDEAGGPYDHVPPVPGHSNDYSDPSVQSVAADTSGIAVNPDSYNPSVPSAGTPTTHCDLATTDPGAKPTDAAAVKGFSAQLGFRVPNMVISPFVRKHYVSHVPMDHTAIIRLVESRFLGGASLTARDAVQPNMLDFFDFKNIPWETPPNPPAAVQRLNREGVEAVKKHDYEKAGVLFYRAYLYDPTDPFTLNNLGYVSELQGPLDREILRSGVETEFECGYRSEQCQRP